MPTLLNADDYRRRARQVLPRGLFEYIDRGTEDETALTRLRTSLDGITSTSSTHDAARFRALGPTLLSRLPCLTSRSPRTTRLRATEHGNRQESAACVMGNAPWTNVSGARANLLSF